MDIIQFLNEKFTDDEIKKVFRRLPKSRLEKIIESLKQKSNRETTKE